MPVVRLDADCNATTIGWCNAMRPEPVPPCFIRVTEPVRIAEYLGEAQAPSEAFIRSTAFEVIELRRPNGRREPAIQTRDGNAPLDWLPGWRPA